MKPQLVAKKLELLDKIMIFILSAPVGDTKMPTISTQNRQNIGKEDCHVSLQ